MIQNFTYKNFALLCDLCVKKHIIPTQPDLISNREYDREILWVRVRCDRFEGQYIDMR
jgi:hypothetical protein